MDQTLSLADVARGLHDLGANVAAKQNKKPLHKWKQLQEQPQSLAQLESLPWAFADSLAIISGVGGYRVFDLDAVNGGHVTENVVRELLEALELPQDYDWVYKSGSGTGWGVVVICHEQLPDHDTGSTLFRQAKLDYLAHGLDHVELKYNKSMTTIWGEHKDGPGYEWPGGLPLDGRKPATVTAGTLLRGLYTLTTRPLAKPVHVNGTAQSKIPQTRSDSWANNYCAKALSLAVDEVIGAAPQTGSNILFYQAASLFELAHNPQSGLSEQSVYRAMLQAATPRRPESEAMATIKSARESAQGKVREIPEGPDESWGPAVQLATRAVVELLPEPDTVPAVTLTEELELLPEPDITAYLDQEEMGDGYLLAAAYQGRLVYDHSHKGDDGWHIWNGRHWERDTTGLVRLIYGGQVADQYLRCSGQLYKKANKLRADELLSQADKTETVAKLMMARTRQLRKKTRSSNALSYAASVPGVSVRSSVWDSNRTILGLQNGTLDLNTGELHPGRPSDYIRTVSPVRWRGLDEPAPRWQQFIMEIMGWDLDMADYIQRLLGYSVSGLTLEHIFPILWGEDGRNGKDTLLETLSYILGELARPADKDVIIKSRHPASGGSASPHVYGLMGTRLAWVSEPDEGARIDSGMVKLLTGGGQLTARPLYGNPVTWSPTHQIMLVTNPRPHLAADDKAVWERVQLIPFNQRFLKRPDPSKDNEHLSDPELVSKLRLESAGILAWLVKGYMSWRDMGLQAPSTVTTATNEYRTAEDTLGGFLSEMTETGQGYSIRAGELYKSYSDWCNENNIRPMTGRTFGQKLTKRYSKSRANVGYVYQGLRLNDTIL